MVTIVDKEEFRIKLDEINHLVEKKDYKGAMEVVDSIDWRRVKNVRTLCVVGEIYAANKRYEDSRDIFLLAYHRASIGKNILVRLVEVSLKMGEIDEAMDYYEEFCSVAPNDNTAYILRYKILREKNAPLDDQIQVLEEYKSREFTEKWSYELAKLYYRAGQKEKAEDICNEMILWFSEGNYVMKAYDLKMRMGVITDKEKEKLDQQLAQKERAAKKAKEKEIEEEKKEEPEEPIIEEVIIDTSVKKDESSEKKEEPEEIREEEISLKDSEEEPEDGEEKEYDGDESEEAEGDSEEGGEDYPEDSEGSGEGGSEGSEESGDAESEDLTESGEEESEDFEEDGDEEEDDEEDSEDSDEEASVDDDSSVIDSIDVSDNRDLNGAESLKERITKSLRSLFGGHRRNEEIEEDEEDSEEYDEETDELTEDEAEEDGEILDSDFEEDLTEDEESEDEESEDEESEDEESENEEYEDEESEDEEYEDEESEDEEYEDEESEDEEYEDEESEDEESEDEESEDEEYEDEESEDEEFEDEDSDENIEEADVLEEEEEESKPKKKAHKKREFRFPEFRIPRSMKKAHIPEVVEKMEILENNKKEEKEAEEEPKEEFNLEDTILAAAFAQGIEIPGAEPKKPETEEEDLLSSGEEEDESDEPVIIEQMIHSEEEKSIKSLEKNTRNSSDSSKEEDEEQDDVPDLIMPDLSSPIEEEEEEESEDDEEEDDVSIEETIIEEMVGNGSDETEDDEEDEEEESLVSAVMGSQNDESDKEMDFYDEDDYSEEDLFEDEQIDQFISSIHPESALSPADIIPRDKNLSEEEIKLFSYFVKVPGMKEQIVDALTDVQMESADNTSNRGNIIVMGGPESGKTRLISGLIPAICKELRLEASKVAYVFAEQINGKDMEKIVSRLFGGFLVIENANQLDQETAVNLTKVMEGDTKGMIFILEDDKIGMRKMMARYPKLAKKFTSIINIPVFTNDELANFARIYAMENGYRIDTNGMLALYNLISMNQKEDMPMNVGAVKEIVDSAIQRSQGGIKLFKKNAEKKRMDQDGFIVLYDKDFGK